MSVTATDITTGYDILSAKRFVAGASALLAYDYCLTFVDEVEHVWRGRKSLVFYLFLANRYNSIIWCLVTLVAYFSPIWTVPICDRFAVVQWFQALSTAMAAEIVLILRVYALTNRNKPIFAFLILIALTQCGIVIFGMSQPRENNALPVPNISIDAFRICILISSPVKDMAYLSVSLAFDSIVFGLTLACTLRGRSTLPILQKIQRDGVMYFFVIFSGNLVWMLLVLHARPGLKYENAQPSLMLTSIMINRLTLSLRRCARPGVVVFGAKATGWTSDFVIDEGGAYGTKPYKV